MPILNKLIAIRFILECVKNKRVRRSKQQRFLMAGLKGHLLRLKHARGLAKSKQARGVKMSRRVVTGVLKHSPIVSTHARGKRARTPVTPFVVADGDDDEDDARARRRRRLDASGASIDDDEDASPVTRNSTHG